MTPARARRDAAARVVRAVLIRAAPLCALIPLAACEAPMPRLYVWDGYAEVIHDTRWRPGAMPVEQQIQTMEVDRERARAGNLKLPPGWRMHLAMLYQMTGDTGRARALLDDEKAAFPESARLVDLLAARLDGAPGR